MSRVNKFQEGYGPIIEVYWKTARKRKNRKPKVKKSKGKLK